MRLLCQYCELHANQTFSQCALFRLRLRPCLGFYRKELGDKYIRCVFYGGIFPDQIDKTWIRPYLFLTAGTFEVFF